MIDWLVQRAADDHQVAAGVAPDALLSALETAVYNKLSNAKRRRDWLLGRWTAKQLLQAAEQKSGHQSSPSQEISILAAKDGAPEIWLGVAGQLDRGEYTLSISHSNGVSFCAIAPASYLLGADIETVETRSSRFVVDYFTGEEKELVRKAPAELRDTLITAIWSGKEAALKAVRKGLHLDTRSISCSFPSFNSSSDIEKDLKDWNLFSLRWSAPTRESNYPQLSGWWRVLGDFVLTLVVTAEPQAVLEGAGSVARGSVPAKIS